MEQDRGGRAPGREEEWEEGGWAGAEEEEGGAETAPAPGRGVNAFARLAGPARLISLAFPATRLNAPNAGRSWREPERALRSLAGWVRLPLVILLGALTFALVPGDLSVAAELTVVYNNVPGQRDLATAWGLSYFVRQGGLTILFDSGGNPDLLRENFRRLGLNPGEIDAVVLSHYHHDHFGGLPAVLRAGLEVYLLEAFPSDFKENLRREGATVIEVKGPRRIREGFFTTGVVEGAIPEQSLLVSTPRGTIVITGCSHPGVEKICRRAREIMGEKLYLVTGGLHLEGASVEKIGQVIAELKRMGVEIIVPNHCTGREAMRLLESAWVEGYIHLGAGDSFIIREPAGNEPSLSSGTKNRE